MLSEENTTTSTRRGACRKESLKVVNRGLAWDFTYKDVFESVSGGRSIVVQKHDQLVARQMHFLVKGCTCEKRNVEDFSATSVALI